MESLGKELSTLDAEMHGAFWIILAQVFIGGDRITKCHLDLARLTHRISFEHRTIINPYSLENWIGKAGERDLVIPHFLTLYLNIKAAVLTILGLEVIRLVPFPIDENSKL